VFNNGGTVDFVKHKVNGYLARYKSPEDFAKGIIYCLENPMEMHLDAEFSTGNIVETHLHLVSELIGVSNSCYKNT
jgi:glycosyltransferase involved in cell wall biosynthesis